MKHLMTPSLAPVIADLWSHGARPLIVGGAVRDAVLDLPAHDLDVEVHDLAPEMMQGILERHGTVDLVGQSFGVYKLTIPGGVTYDFSLPRRDNAIGAGHRDFIASFDPLTPQEAASRRDFTMNALAYDPASHELLDFFNGVDHLKRKMLVPTSEAFKEDPLRVLRAMRFLSRFHLTPSYDLIRQSTAMLVGYHSLPTERIWKEWEGWALSDHPSAGLHFLQDCSWLMHYPDLALLQLTPQDRQYHPEGNVWEHTMFVCDAAASLMDGESPISRLVLVLAALCHDLGKPGTTIPKDGHLVSPSHAGVGAVIAQRFLTQLGTPRPIIGLVATLVREHLAHLGAPVTPRTVRRLANRLDGVSIELWARLVQADMGGRPPHPPADPARPWVDLARTLEVHDQKPVPILRGQYLLDLGFAEGPAIGAMLRVAYEAQLDGAFTDLPGGMIWLTEHQERADVRT